MTIVAQARRMFEEKIARHKTHRDRLVCENAPHSQIEFVERCIADLEKMIAGSCNAGRVSLCETGRDGPGPEPAQE